MKFLSILVRILETDGQAITNPKQVRKLANLSGFPAELETAWTVPLADAYGDLAGSPASAPVRRGSSPTST